MNELKRLSQIFEKAKQIPFDDSSRIAVISDCHRGDGSWADDFSPNRNIYLAALNHYYKEGFTYMELGDGEELWKNRKFSDITSEHGDIYRALSVFAGKGRFYSLYGNHDNLKKSYVFVESRYYKPRRARKTGRLDAIKGVRFHEGLVLKHKAGGEGIFLVHGHQADWFNYSLMWLARFLVRYLWRPLETVGVKDPTSPAKNHSKMDAVEKKLVEWVKKERHMMIAGHTHRPVFPGAGDPPYFNDGSCVQPHGITGIEISGGSITLVKWSTKVKDDGTLFVGRDTLEGPRKLADCFREIFY